MPETRLKYMQKQGKNGKKLKKIINNDPEKLYLSLLNKDCVPVKSIEFKRILGSIEFRTDAMTISDMWFKPDGTLFLELGVCIKAKPGTKREEAHA